MRSEKAKPSHFRLLGSGSTEHLIFSKEIVMNGCRLSKQVPQALGDFTSLSNLDILLSNWSDMLAGGV